MSCFTQVAAITMKMWLIQKYVAEQFSIAFPCSSGTVAKKDFGFFSKCNYIEIKLREFSVVRIDKAGFTI